MGLVLFLLLVVILLGGLGFAVHALWIAAVAAFVVWILGFAFRSGERARWYYW